MELTLVIISPESTTKGSRALLWDLTFDIEFSLKDLYDLHFNHVKVIQAWQDDCRFVSTAHKYLNAGFYEVSREGSGGVYFVTDKAGNRLAVFKPQDEEPGSFNCPIKSDSSPLLDPGYGYLREIAAYILDKSFAGVPETYLITNVMKQSGTAQFGSLQRFVDNDGNSADVSSSLYNTEDIHRIGILDLRIFNMDRNEENLLIKKTGASSYKLVPIDHTYSIPPWGKISTGTWFEWLHWKQAKEPFSQRSLDYIKSIDVVADIQILRALGFDEECVRTLISCTVLLKKGAEMGLTLFDLGNLVTRGEKEPSFMECWVNETLEIIGPSIDNITFLNALQSCPLELGTSQAHQA